jgi:ubiquinone biosynthesis protein
MDLLYLAKLGRFKDIVVTLLKYGFDEVVTRLEVPGIELVKRISHAHQELGTYERIRLVLEDLGPTFIKFGQIMSLRPDLLPAPLLQELSKLQDEVASVEFEEVRKVVEESLGQPIEKVFRIFDPEPLAAASLAQVHRGVLEKEGWVVSTKVRRPGIRKMIETDLSILAAIAARLHERSDELASYNLPGLIKVIRRTLIREIDFRQEARNMKIARSYASGSGIHIPMVYEDHCSERLLVMEYVLGTKLKDMGEGALRDPEALAKRGLRAVIKQILEDGFFHADPHPGNLLITAQEELCFIDWGMVGRLTEKDRHELIDLIKSVVDKDSDGLVHALLRVCKKRDLIDARALEREVLTILDSYHAVPLKDLNIGQMLLEITAVLREYHMSLPPDLVIMVKALVTAERTARRIHPDLDVVTEARGQIANLAVKRFKPELLWRNFRMVLSDFLASQREVPGRFLQILEKLERGDIGLRFHFEELGRLMHTLENSSNRLTFGIIIAALIIGSSMIITTGIGPLLFGFPALGVIGYMISGVLGLWLVFNIIRSKKY